MKGRAERRCWCVDPATGRRFRKDQCPKLRQKDHGAWYVRFDAPRSAGEKRRQPHLGPFRTRRDADEALAAELAKTGSGGPVADRALKVGAYLTAYADGKLDVKPRTLESMRESFRLYWIPALGHYRLTGLRDHHIAEAVAAIMLINQPGSTDHPPEMLRRMLAARADDERRQLPPGEKRHKKSTKPVSPARIRRVFADLHSALQTAVPGRIMVNPCDGVNLPRVRQVKPLPWSADREQAFRVALDKNMAALPGRPTTVQTQRTWADPMLRPCKVMVWLPSHTGRFLDYLDQTHERLIALFVLVAYCGLRRGEVLGLRWVDVDLDQGVAYVLETEEDGSPKSDAGVRTVPLPAVVVEALRAWRRVQAADRLAWGPDWPDTGLVFTRADGTAVPGQWTSSRFETLAFRAGLPPVRFHDLRHGAASLCKAAGLDTKFISELLGHARTSFTDDVYVLLFPEVAAAAAESAAAVVPRKNTGTV